MTVKEMHGSDGKGQSTEGSGVLCRGSEVCDGQRALRWRVCTGRIETLSGGKLSGTLGRAGC